MCCVHQQNGQASPKEVTISASWCCKESGDGIVVGTPKLDEATPQSATDPFEEVKDQSPRTTCRAALQVQIDELLAEGTTFEQHTDKLTTAGRRAADAVAALLKENPEVALKIACYCGDVAGTEWAAPRQDRELSSRQAASVQAVLSEAGCINSVLTQGLGHVDSRGARCEVSLCSAAVFGTLKDSAAREVLGVRLDVVFKDKERGRDVTVAFTRRPLGMDLPHSMPLIVQNVRGQAVDLGVRQGWQVVSIGGYDVEAIPLDDAYRIFQTAAAPLPEEPAPKVTAFA